MVHVELEHLDGCYFLAFQVFEDCSECSFAEVWSIVCHGQEFAIYYRLNGSTLSVNGYDPADELCSTGCLDSLQSAQSISSLWV